MSRTYLGVVEKDADSAWGIWFPDMPGGFPATDEFEDLPHAAAELLRQHVEAMKSHGLVVPDPRPVAEASAGGDVRKAIKGGATTMLVPLLADPRT